MKSKFTIWGPEYLNGSRKWGVNERRDYGVFTTGPRDGFDTRKDAVELLLKVRAEERSEAESRKFFAQVHN